MKTNRQKYPAYKDSGVEWLGEIPNHWEIIRLKNIIRAKITDGPHVTPEFIDEGIPFLSVDGIQNGELVFENSRLISLNDHIKYQKKCRIEKFDILMGKAASIGKIAQSKVDFEYSIWSPLALIKPNLEKFNATFMEYYLKSTLSQYQIEILCTSNTQKNISMDDIPKIILTFPPLPEQTAIAAFLDRKTTLIDQAIGIKQKQIELLKERRQILIHKAVTRGLNPNVKMKDSGVEWIGEIPEGWTVTSVKHVLEMPICDGPHTTPQLYEEGYPFVSAEAIKNGEVDFDKIRGFISLKDYLQFSKKYLPKRNDIYMVKSGATTGNVAMVRTDAEFSIWSPLAVFRANQKKVIPNYLLNYLESPSFRLGVELNWSFGTQQNIGMGILSNLPIAFPSIQEQKNISEYIGQITDKIKSAISLKEQEIEKLKEYKATLINSAVTGKIKVC